MSYPGHRIEPGDLLRPKPLIQPLFYVERTPTFEGVVSQRVLPAAARPLVLSVASTLDPMVFVIVGELIGFVDARAFDRELIWWNL